LKPYLYLVTSNQIKILLPNNVLPLNLDYASFKIIANGIVRFDRSFQSAIMG